MNKKMLGIIIAQAVVIVAICGSWAGTNVYRYRNIAGPDTLAYGYAILPELSKITQESHSPGIEKSFYRVTARGITEFRATLAEERAVIESRTGVKTIGPHMADIVDFIRRNPWPTLHNIRNLAAAMDLYSSVRSQELDFYSKSLEGILGMRSSE